jgi:phosphatidylserine/phosphatidylglycerophosphate/cardiolipin synthase-like enzyme
VDAETPAGRVFSGSENSTLASLEHNRELGVVIVDPTVVAAVNPTLAYDCAGGAP